MTLPRTALSTFAIALFLTIGVGPAARANCTDGNCVPGGGDPATDCLAEFDTVELNYPPFNPTQVVQDPKTELRCFDGDAGCDLDGVANGSCTFAIDVCLAASDPNLPSCTAGTVKKAKVKAKGAKAKPLAKAVKALRPASETACTTGGEATVKLKKKKGAFVERASTIKVKAKTDDGVKDDDELTLRCLPRQWPNHGFDQQSRRWNPLEKKLKPKKIEKLQLKWDFGERMDGGQSVRIGSVTSTPTVMGDFIYIASWDGNLYALDRFTGEERWIFRPNLGPFTGFQSSAMVTADGRIVVVDDLVNAHCINATTGELLWSQNLGAPPIDHVWSSAQAANGRVFIGVGALLDDPATPGVLYGLDLDTGEILWSFRTVPEMICTTDTTIECTSDGDCPSSGSCTEGLGGAITATVVLDPTGEQVYMNTVGSYTFPSIGDSDSIFRFDAADGNLVWKTRVTAGEQFGFCEGDSSIDCGTSSVCGAFGPCTTKPNYHDFGFLNGPMLVPNVDGTPLLVSGSKDGTLYAFDPDTGEIEWTNEILPVPVSPGFAAWGLFNGAIAYADGRIVGALYGHGNPSNEPPNHLQAFNVGDGTVAWADDIGESWGDVSIAAGVAYTGTQASSDVYAYDLETGARLRTFAMPENVAGGPTIVDGWLYIPYGVLGEGGVQAWALK